MSQKLKYNVNYNDIKRILIKSSQKPTISSEDITADFVIDYEKLSTLADELNLIPIPFNASDEDDKRWITSALVNNYSIRMLQEYFKGENLKWLSSGERFFANIVFVYTEGLDRDSINYIKSSVEFLLNYANPSVSMNEYDDTAKVIASTLLADFPCYVANDVSYISSDPDRSNRISYNIQIRANTVVLKSDAYKYNHNDMV